MSDEWDDVGYVITSKYRIEVLERLHTGPASPSLIAEDSGRSMAHVSRALQELQDEGLVSLLVSEERRKGRVYGITEEGETAMERIRTQDMV